MRGMNAWRLVGGVSAALVLAVAFYTMGVPINDPCMPCQTGQMPWWACWLIGCW